MIHILSPDVYNRIAAGEVVDRPYSVVKELVENSIDAGATEINIEIEGGGKQKIRVADNGCGISEEDLPNAYHPHATSKLLDAEDLFTVSTLGFRGEAIASIASVSKMNIVSDAGAGAHSLACEGGVLGKVLPSAGARGTEITVCDLFYNTPARLKFLKSDSQEETDVTNMIARFILSRPEISFTYTANGKLKYRSLGEGLPSAIAVVYGASTLDHCLEISADKHGILLHGFIGDRNFSKPNRTYQSLFVNGRYVVNQTVGSAVTNAYAAYLMKRQYPFYVLFLDLPKEIVDVNVHPNKADVRFQDNQIIYGSVYSVLSSVLDGSSRAVEYLVGYRESGEEGTAEKSLPETPAAPVSDRTMTYEEAKKELQFDISPLKNGPSEPRFYTPDPVEYAVHAPTASATVETQEDVFAENQRFLREEEHRAKQAKVDVKNLTFKGELFRTYLLYEAGDEAYIVDQHAAHERLNYDRLQAKLAARNVVSQPMLVPYLLEVNPAEFAFLTKNFPILREMGFEIEEFGSGCVKVSAVPSDLVNINLSAFFGEVLTSMESLRAIKLSELLKDRLASAACKAAVKGGEYLTDEEAKKLLERMDGDMGLKCPHGRPVAVKVKRSELEKLFTRIV